MMTSRCQSTAVLSPLQMDAVDIMAGDRLEMQIDFCSDQGEGAQMLIKLIARSADAGPGGWVGLKRKLLHLDVDGSGAVNAEGERVAHAKN